jgi:hypothetical protein
VARRGAEASWPASMPRLEGVGYQSQEGEGCDCGQLMRGRVKRGKGRSLGLHGAGGRERRRPWCGWRAREAVARALARAGEGRGKGDPRPVGQLGLLTARRVGLKATRPEGMRGK